MIPKTPTTAGIIGLGAMGAAMVHHLLASGIEVVGHDIDEFRCGEASRSGVQIVDPARIGERTDIIITSMPSFAAAHSVLSVHSPLMMGLTPESIIVETSTLALHEKVELARNVEECGSTLLDCPMSGTAHQARNADLVAYLSGDTAAKERVRVVLEPFTRSIRDLGAFGNGTLTKLIANHLVAVHNVAAAEALAIANAAGMDTVAVLDAVAEGAGNSRMLQVRGPLMIAEDYLPAGMRVDLFMKDLGLISALSQQLGTPSPLLDAAHEIYRLAMAQGREAEDTACAFSVLRNLRSGGDRVTDEA